MEIKDSKNGDVRVLSLAGSVDTRSALDFDRHVQKLLDEGARRFVVDFERVELLTSSGLRVLLKLAKTVEGGGGLVLCSLNDHTRSVLDISGLTRFFRTAPSRDAALDKLPTPVEISAVTTLVGKAVGVDSGRAAKKGEKTRSALTDAVDRALSDDRSGD